MATINFNGTVSGLDTGSMIDAIMAAERLPLKRLQARRTDVKASQTAYTKLASLMSALEAAGKAFTSSLVGGKRAATSSNPSILSASAAANALSASYAVNVTHLATATVATSAGPIGTAVTEATAVNPMATLPLPGTVKAGTASVVVDGTIVRVAVGDPAATSLRDVLDGLAAGVQAQVRGTAGSENAVVTAAIVDNKVQLTLAGTANTHAIAFGAGGDTSNLLGIVGLAGVDGSAWTSAAPIGARSVLGVVQTSRALDASGLTGLTSTATGTLTVNGAAIAYDTTTDSLATIVSRINASTANVTASLDRANDRIVLTGRSGGPTAISIEDTAGNLGAALQLAPGTTNAQVLGTRATLTVDGRPVVADSNHVTSAIEGVSLDLLALGSSTVTVNADRAAMKAAIRTLVGAFNDLADNLDTATANVKGQTPGPLAAESGLRGLALGLRQVLLGVAPAVSGSIRSLSDIGITTGVVGSAKGTTSRLQFDEAKFDAAVDVDPDKVAELLGSKTGAIQPLLDRLGTWTKSGGRLSVAQATLTSMLRDLDTREARLNERLDDKQAALVRKFAAMEQRLSELQSVQQSLGSQVSSMSGSGSG